MGFLWAMIIWKRLGKTWKKFEPIFAEKQNRPTFAPLSKEGSAQKQVEKKFSKKIANGFGWKDGGFLPLQPASEKSEN